MAGPRDHSPETGQRGFEEAEELRPERLGGAQHRRQELRPERLGQRVVEGEALPETPLDATQVRDLLKAHAGWELAPDGSALRRSRRFPTLRAAASFVHLVAELSEAYGYVPDIDLRHLEVTLRIDTNHNLGLTERDFAMARALGDW